MRKSKPQEGGVIALFTSAVSLRSIVLFLGLYFVPLVAGCGGGRFPNVRPYEPGYDLDRKAEAALYLKLLSEGINETTQETHIYRIHPTDVIEITVFQYEKMNLVTRVSVAGKINFPPLGEIQAAGLTQSDLETAIENGLDGRFIKNPNVIVSTREAVSQNVTIIGEVNTPGQQAVWGETRLLDVLARAGGLTKEAGNIAYFIRSRPKDSASLADSVNMNDKETGLALPNEQNPIIRSKQTNRALRGNNNSVKSLLPDATVSFSPANTVLATSSAVGSSSLYPFHYLRTVSGGESESFASTYTLESALLEAMEEPETETFRIYLAGLLLRGEKEWNIVLRPGDTITIPPAGAIHVTGPAIDKPGTYPLTFMPKTMRQVLDEAGGLKRSADRKIILARVTDDDTDTFLEVDYVQALQFREYDPKMQPGDTLIVQTSFWRRNLNAMYEILLTTGLSWSEAPYSVRVGNTSLNIRD